MTIMYIVYTFIDIVTCNSIAFKSTIARAGEGSLGVGTVGIGITIVGICLTFVDI